MKTPIVTLFACVAATLAANAQVGSGCFWSLPIITSSPGTPLTGSGFGSIGGKFNQVQWYDGNIAPPGSVTNLGGTFSYNVGWNDPDGNGIDFTTDWSVPGMPFNTTPGDTLLFGGPNVTVANPGCTVDAIKLLICLVPTTKLQTAISNYTSSGYSVYVGDGTSYFAAEPDGSFLLDPKTLGYVGSDITTQGLSYAFSKDGTTFEPDGGGTSEDFDTIVKIGACVTCVPEPSTALAGLLGAGLMLVRRRRN